MYRCTVQTTVDRARDDEECSTRVEIKEPKETEVEPKETEVENFVAIAAKTGLTATLLLSGSDVRFGLSPKPI